MCKARGGERENRQRAGGRMRKSVRQERVRKRESDKERETPTYRLEDDKGLQAKRKGERESECLLVGGKM